MAVHYIKAITEMEINETPSAPVIFRGNTVATKSVDMYMRLTGTLFRFEFFNFSLVAGIDEARLGMPYLHHCVKDIVQEIWANGGGSGKRKKSCEVSDFLCDAHSPERWMLQDWAR